MHEARAGKQGFAWHRTCRLLRYLGYDTGAEGCAVEKADSGPPGTGIGPQRSCMTILDLIKATVVFGAIAFLIYSYPIVGQIVLIGFLSLLWLLYAHKTITNLRRR